MKLEKIYKNIFEVEVGDKLFADLDAAKTASMDKGFNRDFKKWVEKVYGPDYEINTPEEEKMFWALGAYFGDAGKGKELGAYVDDLKALKAKFPRMLNPEGTTLPNDGYAYRGAKMPIEQYEKLIRKSIPNWGTFTQTAQIDNPGITYKSRGQYGFTSFTTEFPQAVKFANSWKEKGDYVNVVYGVKLDNPNLVINPSFANAMSEYYEDETLYVGNSITPDVIHIVDPRFVANVLYDIKAYEEENDLPEFSVRVADFYPKWAKTHTPRLDDFNLDGTPKKKEDKKVRLDKKPPEEQAKIDKLKALQAKKYAKNENISLYKVYTEILNEGVWSKSALARMRATPMEGRYFITDEEGNMLEKGLKTDASVRAYFTNGAKMGGYLEGKIPKVVNVHDNKKGGKVVNQYFWGGKKGIIIDKFPSGQYGVIDPQYVKYQDSIEEVYTEILREIGELDPSKALPYKLTYDDTRSVLRFVRGKQEYTFRFTQDQDGYPNKKIMMVKLVYEGNGIVRIDFNPIGAGEIPILGDSYKSAYTIMNTVGTIVKQSLKDTLEKGITKTLVTAAKNEYDKKNPEQRQQMYTLFIKKAFPGAVVSKSGMLTTLPDDYAEYL